MNETTFLDRCGGATDYSASATVLRCFGFDSTPPEWWIMPLGLTLLACAIAAALWVGWRAGVIKETSAAPR